MTTSVGGLSVSVIACIAAGGIFGLLIMIILLAILLDMPKRMKRKQNAGIMEVASKRSLEIMEVEKGSANVSETEISSTNYSSVQPTRPASPECQCKHPVVVVHPPRI